MAKIKLKLPKLGMSMEEAVITQWHVSDGDIVTLDQDIYEVETDKATMDVECPFEGVITLIAKAGQSYKIGEIIAEIET
jgi:pyruvate/2-oxoglutarate dehydrogenase complex dihydrolipoamide acyltransferase (E2) component